MRGSQKFDLPIPAAGFLKDRPTQLVGTDGLIAGQNMMLDADGYYRPRYGYMPWKTNNPSEALLGLISFIDTDGTYQFMGAGPSQVWWLNAANQWQGVGGNLHGTLDNLATIIPFFQPFIDGATAGNISAIVCNAKDQLVIFNKTLSSALPLTPVHAAGSGNTLAFNTTPSFGAYPVSNPGPNWFFTVTGANTAAVTLAINGLAAKSVMAIISGVLSALPSGYLQPNTTYNISYDGTEFVIGTNILAPIARAACSLNGRIVAVNITSGAITTPCQVTWSSAFDASLWAPANFYNLLDDSDELVTIFKVGFNAAVIFGRSTGYLVQGIFGGSDANAFSFTPINGYKSGPPSPLLVVPWPGGLLWLAEDKRIWTTDGQSAQPFSAALTGLLRTALNDATNKRFFAFEDKPERRIWFMVQQSTTPTVSTGVVIGLDPQPHFETLQQFPTLFTAACNARASSGSRWSDLTHPWNTYNVPWNSFGQQNQLMQLAVDATAVHLFGQLGGVTDNGKLIFYSMTPGLLTEGPEQDLRPESFDLYTKLVQTLELATIQFDGLNYPDDSGTTVLASVINFNDAATFVSPQVDPTVSTYSRYLRMTVSGYSVLRACAYGGMRVYTNVQGRPSL